MTENSGLSEANFYTSWDDTKQGIATSHSFTHQETSLQQQQLPDNISSPEDGHKHLQTKIMTQLAATDAQCAYRVKQAWEKMIDTTLRDREKSFTSLKQYVDFRLVETYAPFVEAMMLWGMSTTLTPEEDSLFRPVVHPCFAALGLANDYFSFDRDVAERQVSGSRILTNAVWLLMKWHNVDSEEAKEMVREATVRYEQEFLQRREVFRREHAPLSEKSDRYLRALSYQISGNVVWSLNCPRYHPAFR